MTAPAARRAMAALTALLLGAACALGAAWAQGGRPSAAPPARSSAAPPGGPLMVGIADDNPSTFSDPRFRWLGLSTARYVVPWDVVSRRGELAHARVWLFSARLAGISPLIAFDHSIQRPALLPSVRTYRHAVAHFMSLFPWVSDYTPWNEENHALEPTAHDPARAAAYFNTVSALCGRCTVTAADVLDEPNMSRWVHRFLAHAHNPQLWGLHNYFDLNHGGHRNTSKLLALVRGQVWFTEVGGLVWRFNSKTRSFVVRGESFAARAAERLIRLAEISPRIRRIYYYHWQIDRTLAWARRHGGVTWDSGLVRPDCSVRPALLVLARALGRNPRQLPRAVHARTGCRSVIPLNAIGPPPTALQAPPAATAPAPSSSPPPSSTGAGSTAPGSSSTATSPPPTSSSSTSPPPPPPQPCVLGIVCQP